MKKSIKAIFVTAITALSVLTLSVAAHPGRTDANGGHYNRSTGEYHYHHGYPAHQHPGGYCPYTDNNDNDHDVPPVNFGDLDEESSSASWSQYTSSHYNSSHSESKSSYSHNSSKANNSASKSSSEKSPSESDNNILAFIIDNFVWIWIIPVLLYKIIVFLYHKIKTALSKKRVFMFCKYCGEKISRKDKICPNCKKQLKTGISIKEKLTAFWGQGSKKKTIIMTSIIGVLIVALAVESVFLGQAQSDITGLQEQVSSVTKQKETQYDSLTSTIASLRDDVTSEQSRASYYFEQYISAKDGYDFLMDHIVLVTEDGSKYHKYNCRYVKGKPCYAFNTETAIARGYTPCSICFGN